MNGNFLYQFIIGLYGGNPHEWKRGQWWKSSFYPIDFIFGREKYTEIVNEKGITFIPLYEATYFAYYKLFISIWKRPFFYTSIKRIDFDFIPPIPIPGKGENSWDCGQDSISSTVFPADNIEQAIGKVIQDVLETRKRYGQSHLWEPKL